MFYFITHSSRSYMHDHTLKLLNMNNTRRPCAKCEWNVEVGSKRGLESLFFDLSSHQLYCSVPLYLCGLFFIAQESKCGNRCFSFRHSPKWKSTCGSRCSRKDAALQVRAQGRRITGSCVRAHPGIDTHAHNKLVMALTDALI